MAILSITIPNPQVNRVQDAVCYINGYTDQVDNGQGVLIANPRTKTQFTKDMIIAYIFECVKAYEAQTAVNAARQNAINSVQTGVQLS